MAPDSATVPEDRVNATVRDREAWVTDGAWISGLCGALAVVVVAAVYRHFNVLSDGLRIGAWSLTSDRTDSLLLALGLVGLSMVGVEGVRLRRWNRAYGLSVHPDVRQGRWLAFLGTACLNYALHLLLLWLAQRFFQTAGEYGYLKGHAFYRPWFRLIELLFTAWLWGGLPYVVLTRALKHDPQADRRDYGFFVARLLSRPWQRLLGAAPGRDDGTDRKTGLGLIVKLFFAPLMTVFFCDQFVHLTNNLGYLAGGGWWRQVQSPGYGLASFNRDLFNISTSLIFSIDVALAWCGYVISSRWVDNQTVSAEPTALGWLVCLLCYPPFQSMLGLYYAPPSDRAILGLQPASLACLFTVMMVLSYVIYMSATVCFGLRFSNLTNRGIVRTGPFAFVRHPAYAAKNLSWWLVMFPVILYHSANTGLGLALSQFIGLCLMSFVYFHRAMTEERHLGADPRYREYCAQVRWRFIPGIY